MAQIDHQTGPQPATRGIAGANTGVGEAAVEAHLRDLCRREGFLAMKFTSPSRSGVPDRLLVTPLGSIFVELKRPGAKLREQQRQTHEHLRHFGAEVHVVDSIQAAEALIDQLLSRIAAERCETPATRAAQRAGLETTPLSDTQRRTAIRQAARQALRDHAAPQHVLTMNRSTP